MSYEAEEYEEKLSADLLEALNCIGTVDKQNVFNIGANIHYGLQALFRALKNDTADHKIVHLKLGHWQILSSHIIPLFLAKKDDERVIKSCIKIFGLLTDGISDNERIDDANKRLIQLQQMKDIFIKGDTLAVLAILLKEHLIIPPTDRNEDTIKYINLYLWLFKNLLLIPNPNGKISEINMKYLHDRLLLKMSNEHVLDLLILCSHQLKEVKKEYRIERSIILNDAFAGLFFNEHPSDLLNSSYPAILELEKNKLEKNKLKKIATSSIISQIIPKVC